MLLLAAIAWLAGASLAALGWPLGLVAFVPLTAAGWVVKRTSVRRVAFALALLPVALLGARWYASHLPNADSRDVSHRIAAGPAVLTGTVSGETYEREQAILARIRVASVEDDRGMHPATGTVQLRLLKSAHYSDGDRIEVRGRLVPPSDSPGGDYAAYLQHQGIFAEVDYPGTRLLRRAPPPEWLTALSRVVTWPPPLHALLVSANSSTCTRTLVAARECLATATVSALPEPEATIGADTTFGTRHAYAPVFQTQLAQTATAPLVVATGYNVTVVAVAGLAFLTWLVGRRGALIGTMGLLIGYSWFLGWTPSVLRAALMGAIVIGAGLLGRPHSGVRTLVIAAALMVLVSPSSLTDLSFPLSLASTGGLLLFADPLGTALRRLFRVQRDGGNGHAWSGGMLDGVALTTSASLASLPVTMIAFGTLSFGTLPANILLFPMVPWVMAVSALMAAAVLSSTALAAVLAPLAWGVLRLVALVIELCSRLPGSDLAVGPAAIAGVIVVGLILLGGSDLTPAGRYVRGRLANADIGSAFQPFTRLFAVTANGRIPQMPEVPWLLIGAVALATGIALGAGIEARDALARPEVRVSYLDVGPGSAILIESGDQRILVGGGPPGGNTIRALDAALLPWQRSLNAVVIADASPETIGGLPQILSRYRVGALIDDAPAATSPLAEQDVVKAAVASNVERLPRGPLQIRAGAATITVDLAQPATKPPGPRMATVLMGVGLRRFVLAGDDDGSIAADVRGISPSGESAPVAPARIEILDTGPAGSTSTTLASVPEALRSALVYRTLENGTVTVESDGASLVARVERGPLLGLFAPR